MLFVWNIYKIPVADNDNSMDNSDLCYVIVLEKTCTGSFTGALC